MKKSTRTAAFAVLALAGAGMLPAIAQEAPALVYYVPGVTHAEDADGSVWVTDLSVFNPEKETVRFTLVLRAPGPSLPKSFWIPRGQQIEFEDVVATTFGREGTGYLTVRGGPLEIRARTYSRPGDACSGGGTVGKVYEAVPRAGLLSGRDLGTLPGLRSDAGFRTDLELVNPGSSAAGVSVRFYDGRGRLVGWPLERQVEAGESLGIPGALAPGIASAFAEVRVNPPEAGILAYASVVNERSKDPKLVPMDVVETDFARDLSGSWDVEENLHTGNSFVLCGRETVFEPKTSTWSLNIRQEGSRVWIGCDDESFPICLVGDLRGDRVLVESQGRGRFNCNPGTVVPFTSSWSVDVGVSSGDLLRGSWVYRVAWESDPPVESRTVADVVFRRQATGR